jgi:hypothetical protein
MRKNTFLVLALTVTLLLVTCAPAATPLATETPAEVPVPLPTPTSASSELTPAAIAAMKALEEQLSIPAKEITVVKVEPVQWPDSCLGVVIPDVACAQMVTPGYRIILTANGVEYEYHTDETGAAVRRASGPQASPGGAIPGAVITWHREGGIAGFCDDVVIDLNGTYTVSNCKTGETLKGTLTDGQLEQVLKFAETYATFENTASNGAVADSMTV